MKAHAYLAAARPAVLRNLLPGLLCCFALALAACQTPGSSGKAKPPVNPNERVLAYGVSLILPSAWNVAGSIGPEAASKESLNSRRQNGERVLLLEALGPAGPRGLESMIAIFLVNEEGTFMPRDYAEKLRPEEFDALGKDLLKREQASAKKQKTKNGLLDVRIARDTVGGKLAISQHMLVAGQDGKPVRLMNWDIYMPDGAGIAVKTVCDPDHSGAEEQLLNVVRSIRIQ